MVYQKISARKIANALLQINAIKLNLQKPYVWASGWQSPIYCDNRISLSYPLVRKLITDTFLAVQKNYFSDINCIAAVATAGIAHGMLLADRLKLPFVYVRATAKNHGLKNLIEGKLPRPARVLVIEDLVSTGQSSMKAVEALRAENAEIAGLLAIFSYEFSIAEKTFEQAQCKLITLSGYEHLLEEALQLDYIDQSMLPALNRWRKNPEFWQCS